MNRWTIKEIHELKQLYPNTCNYDLMVKFNRTYESIKYVANKYGLKKSFEYKSQQGKIQASKTGFKKGVKSWISGKVMGVDFEPTTQFKKGIIPHNKTPQELIDVTKQLQRLKKNIRERERRKERKDAKKQN